MTVLEGMQMMHDMRFLSLPVCAEDGSILGVLGVMDLIHGCGGKEGWRSIFNQTFEMDDMSDSGTAYSKESTTHSKVNTKKIQKETDFRPVSKLRPKKPVISSADDTVFDVSQLLANKRADATIVVDAAGALVGILTDTDVTRRVVAKHIDPAEANVSEVMTADPACFDVNDSAMDAMAMMVENRFRHLPVTDADGSVVGVLDIAKLLNDAIDRLERSIDKSKASADDVVTELVGKQGAGGAQAQALQALLSQVMAQAFGNQASPTLGGLLAGKPAGTIVSPETSVREAAMLMATERQAALIVDDGELKGILGFKDILTRVCAKGLSPDSTCVSEVMTKDPETCQSSMTVLEGMQMMHDMRFLSLPVCAEDGSILGVLGVMDLIHGCGGKEGWRSIFSNAVDGGSVSGDSASAVSKLGELPVVARAPRTPVRSSGSPFPNNIPTTLEFRGVEDDTSTINDTRVESKSLHDSSVFGLSMTDTNHAIFKVVDPKGNTHRIRSELNLANLKCVLIEKGVPKTAQLQFVDDEGDTIVVSSDSCLAEAAALSRSQGNKVIKLTAKEVESSLDSSKFLLAGVGAVVAAAGAAAFMLFSKPRK